MTVGAREEINPRRPCRKSGRSLPDDAFIARSTGIWSVERIRGER